MTRKRILLIGLNPAGYDYADSPFADLTVDEVMEGLNRDLANLREAGYEPEMLLVDPADDVLAAVGGYLDRHWDCILVGAALRTTPRYFLLFEQVLNEIHRAAPAAGICFNTGPHDSLEAIRRWA